MRQKGLLAAAAVLVAATSACSAGQAGDRPVVHRAPAEVRQYVSLGDSFAAGGGLSGAIPPCGRGPAAYPSLVAAQHGRLVGSFHACSGATVADVLDRAQFPGEGPQIGAVTAATGVVTISIGGNDIGFGPRLRSCVLDELPCTRLEAEVSADLAALAPRLAAVYAEIRRRAPEATLYAVGYPQLVADPDQAGYQSCAGLTADEARWVRAKGAQLAGVVKAAAAAFGARYLDAAARFTGHEACTPEPWMSGISLTAPDGSFHPNAAGHRELAALVVDALR